MSFFLIEKIHKIFLFMDAKSLTSYVVWLVFLRCVSRHEYFGIYTHILEHICRVLI